MEKFCNICPRNCGVDRNVSTGFCGATNKMQVSKVMLHFFEEPIISGTPENGNANGSGAIFFSSCSLRCCYCQNSEISTKLEGKEISPETLVSLFKQLEKTGANNINLVTPIHYTEQIVEALKIYKPSIPVVWNTSGYEKAETIEMLGRLVDIFLTDLKYYSSEVSNKLSLAPNYFEEASKAVLQMRKNQPSDVIENGLMKKGVIIRHLCLPTLTNDSKKVLDWIYENLSNKTIVSLMSQYVPMANAKKCPEINRKIKPVEYKILVNHLNKLGFENAFIQDFESAETIYTPNFADKQTEFEY